MMLMDILLPAIPGITTRHLPQHRILSIMLGTEFFHPPMGRLDRLEKVIP
jgi:hypothetical protein